MVNCVSSVADAQCVSAVENEESNFSISKSFINPPWDEMKDYSTALKCLSEGRLIYSCPMQEFLKNRHKAARFSNEVYYGVLQYEQVRIAIAYKPKQKSELSAAYAEKIAYEVYEKMIAPHTGHHLIPPTVVRMMPDSREASCQFFVETEDNEDMWEAAFREKVFKNGSSEIIEELAVFNSVFNNWDRHPGNYLATQRDGRIHFASIDNEGIENKGWLENWGERSYIPIAFLRDDAPRLEKELELPAILTLEEFKALLFEYGFSDIPRLKVHFENLMERGGSDQAHPYIKIKESSLALCFHQQNEAAFPLPKGPYPQALINAYRSLNRETLEECFQPLVSLDPERFKSRVDDILTRRDLFLTAAHVIPK